MSARRATPLVIAVALSSLLVAACGHSIGSGAKGASSSLHSEPTIATTSTPSASAGATPTEGPVVVADETAAEFATRAFAASNAAGRAKSCPQSERFYRDYLLPPLAAALTASGTCSEAQLDAGFTYRVTGVSRYDAENFYTDPIPAQTLAPLDKADSVVRVDIAKASDKDFVNFWLVVGENGRFYLYHPVLFQIASCFDDHFALLDGAPTWCKDASVGG